MNPEYFILILMNIPEALSIILLKREISKFFLDSENFLKLSLLCFFLICLFLEALVKTKRLHPFRSKSLRLTILLGGIWPTVYGLKINHPVIPLTRDSAKLILHYQCSNQIPITKCRLCLAEDWEG